MSLKISQDKMESIFADRGCELLDVYQNKSTAMKFKCRCGNLSTISYSSFRRGSYCLGCSGKQKKTFDEVKQFIENNGYCLLDEEYVNAFHIMKTTCPEGHLYETHWNNFQQGRRCLRCGWQKTAEAIRLDYDRVKEAFEERGCTLLTTEYKSNMQKLDYICSCGNKSSITFANLTTGHKCQKCRIENMSGSKHPLWISDREEANLREQIRRKCMSALRHTLKMTSQDKLYKSFKMLGYRPKDLKEHIVGHPDWFSVKDKKWHLDHIFPIKAFCDYKITDLALINCLENLRPMERQENLKKSSKYDKKKFEAWLTSKGVNWQVYSNHITQFKE